ncbi:MAG: hypothetical protein IJ785_00030 [Bacteroidales bacterium]|nr:hypothetical protein [Bacteroidales bacterium]
MHAHRSFPPVLARLSYGVCAVNTLFLLLAAVDYLFVEVDLFLLVWIGASVAIVTLLLGLVMFVYALFHLRSRAGRVVSLWSIGIVVAAFVVFWLLPPGVSRVPYKMEAHYLAHRQDMERIAHQLYSQMPDSTLLVVTSNGTTSLSRITSGVNGFGHPIVDDSVALPPFAFRSNAQMGSLVSQMSQIGCKRLHLYRPTGLALFDYAASGFASYWFEIPFSPFTDEQMRAQELTPQIVPYSRHVFFRFHGGATDGDGAFPYREAFLAHHPPSLD